MSHNLKSSSSDKIDQELLGATGAIPLPPPDNYLASLDDVQQKLDEADDTENSVKKVAKSAIKESKAISLNRTRGK